MKTPIEYNFHSMAGDFFLPLLKELRNTISDLEHELLRMGNVEGLAFNLFHDKAHEKDFLKRVENRERMAVYGHMKNIEGIMDHIKSATRALDYIYQKELVTKRSVLERYFEKDE